MSSRPSAGPVVYRAQALDDSLLKCSCKRIWVIRIQSFAFRTNPQSCTFLLTAESAAFRREYLSSLSEVHLISSTKDEVAETELCHSFAFLVIVPSFCSPGPRCPSQSLTGNPLGDTDASQRGAVAAPCRRSSGPARSNLRASVRLNYVSTWEDSESGSNKIIFCCQWDLMSSDGMAQQLLK